MKILIVEKLYYPYSGVHKYCLDLVEILRNYGHQVVVFDGFRIIPSNFISASYINNAISKNIFLRALESLFSFRMNFLFGKILDKEKPDIVHINNIHHLISSSIIFEAKKRHIPIVYNLHDYKLVCPIYKLMRSNKLCTACKNGNYHQLLLHKCFIHKSYNLFENFFLYIESHFNHNILKSYRYVDVFIAPSQYVKHMYERMGFKGTLVVIPYSEFSNSKLKLLPNNKRKVAVFFGRLVPEKGLLNLIHAVATSDIDLRIIGSGVENDNLRHYCKTHYIKNVSFVGFLEKQKLIHAIQKVNVSVVPSLWPEPFANVIIESFALGKPVIASRTGGSSEAVIHEKNGYLYEAGNIRQLQKMLRRFIDLSREKELQMSKNAFDSWKKYYAPEIHYKSLMQLYKSLS